MKYMIDIDNTICTTEGNDYKNSKPIFDRIWYFNSLYDEGHEIVYWTARGGSTGINWAELTRLQFFDWGVKYSDLKFNKPHYDIWIDDKAVNVERYFDDIDYRA